MHLKYNNKTILKVLIIAFGCVFLLWGCDGDNGGGGGGGGVNFGHALTITITDSTGAAVAGLTAENITVTTESGEVGTIAVAGTQVTFSVEGMDVDPTYITMTVDLVGYYPLVRIYRATVEAVTDESGESFVSVLVTYTEIPEGGGVEESPPVTHDPEEGTTDDISPTTPVDAGGGNTATATLPAGSVFTDTQGGAVTDQISMKLTYHQGTSNQESFYPGGTYGGDNPNVFGNVSFATQSGDSILLSSAATLSVDLTFSTGAAQQAEYAEASEASERQGTTVAISRTTDGQQSSTTIGDFLRQTGDCVDIPCEYDDATQEYTCDNVQWDMPSQTHVDGFRVDTGLCP